jgi:hypothetical protein
VEKDRSAVTPKRLLKLRRNLEGNGGNANQLANPAADEKRASIDRADERQLRRSMSGPRDLLPDEA